MPQAPASVQSQPFSAVHAWTISPAPAGADPRLVRNVNYVYGGSDPEQVTALTNVSGGATYASYTYDAAGNQLTLTCLLSVDQQFRETPPLAG